MRKYSRDTITLENSVNQIAASSEQQSATAEEISRNIESINNINQEASGNARVIAQHSEDLNRRMNDLHGLISMFKTDERGVAVSSGKHMVHY